MQSEQIQQLIDQCFDQAMIGVVDTKEAVMNKLTSDDWGVSTKISQAFSLQNMQNLSNIPHINELQKYDQYNHCLVRYTGVVQDILETLYAAIAIKKQVEGKYAWKRYKYKCNEDVTDESNTIWGKATKIVLKSLKFQNKWAGQCSQQTTCIAYIYDYDDKIKLNDTIEVIGILEIEDAEPVDTFLADKLPNESKYPHIHSLLFYENILNLTNPSIDPLLLKEMSEKHTIMADSSFFKEARELLYKSLYYAVGQSKEAAEYLLLFLLSKVIKRKDVTVIGKFPLNLRCDPLKSEIMDKLSQYIDTVISLISRFSLKVDLSLNKLEKEIFHSHKLHETGEMECGYLQLCSQTYLIVNECTLQQGKLFKHGVSNLQTLQSIITDQKIFYDFQYQNVEALINAPILTISAGKSLFSNHTSVKVEDPKLDMEGVLNKLMSDETLLNRMRQYLALLTSPLIETIINEDLNKRIQQDYVQSRAKDDTINVSDLTNWITLCKLYCLSVGEQQVKDEHYSKIRELENWRRGCK